MITIRLNYPYKEDLYSFNIPLPRTFEVKGVCVLLFDDTDTYCLYVNELCDMVDEMEFDRRTSYSRLKTEKLRFCKDYLELLTGMGLN
jgi:hypothetical protein